MLINNKIFTDYLKNLRSSKFSKVLLWDILSKGSDFALLPIYLKILSPAEYGFYTYALYIIVTIAGIIKLGLDNSVSKMYYETEKYDRRKMIFSLNIIWFIFFFLLFSFLLITGLDVKIFTEIMNIPVIDYNEMKIFILVFIFFSLIQTTLNTFFVIDDNVIKYQKYNLFRTLVVNIIIILLLVFFAKGNKAYFRLHFEPILYILSFIPLIVIFLKKMTFEIDWKAIKHGLVVGLPMLGTLVVGVIFNLSDKYFLQDSKGYEVLAVYNLAFFLTLPVSLIFASFNTVWTPMFFQEKSLQINFIKSNKYFKTLTLFFLALLVIAELMIIIALKIDVLDNAYHLLVYIYPVIFISKIAENLTQIYNNFIIKWGKTIFNLVVSIFFGSLILFLNYKLIPIWGIYAAVILLICTSFTRLLTFYLFVRININSSTNPLKK